MEDEAIIWIFTPGELSLAEFVPPLTSAQPQIWYFQSWRGKAKVWKKTATQFNWWFHKLQLLTLCAYYHSAMSHWLLWGG